MADRNEPTVAALQWAHRITSVSLTGIVPAILGWYLDTRWQTSPWLLLAGTALGMTLSFLELMRVTGVWRRPGRK